MSGLSGLRVAIAGGGVLGLSAALQILEAGADVEVWDPAGPLDNASGVAAGMIAPAAEGVFDALDAPHQTLLTAARDRWRARADLVPDLIIDQAGAILLFPDPEACDMALSRLVSETAIRDSADPSRLFAQGDWRLDPRHALPALRRAIAVRGGEIVPRRLDPEARGRADVLILANGMAARSACRLAPELRVLAPIKGQLVRFSGGPSSGPVLRSADLYLVPHPGGAVAGGTMEIGRDDRIVEPATINRIRNQAISLWPDLEGLPFEGAAGVRAATPDRLPLVGPSSCPGIFLAVGARRNGWLLSPLVAEILVAYLNGGGGGAFGPIVAPRRWLAD